MMSEIFISYSTKDKDKVELVGKLLASSADFSPVIIASDREALKPLAQKVADGITRSHFIVPIITRNSITTQWINQEIGFATALKKPILPIVEASLIDELKGFIHKQIDLPYSYPSSQNRAQENREFLRQFKLLLGDLSSAGGSTKIVGAAPAKTDLEKSLEGVERLYGEESFQSQRKQFVSSEVGHAEAINEFNRLTNYASTKAAIVQEKLKDLIFEKGPNDKSWLMKSNGQSLTMAIERVGLYLNEQESILFVKHWSGNFSFNPNQIYFSEDYRPKTTLELTFKFDLNRLLKPCWTESERLKEQYSSEQLVDISITKLIDEIVRIRSHEV